MKKTLWLAIGLLLYASGFAYAKEVTSENFEQEVLKASKPVLVELYAKDKGWDVTSDLTAIDYLTAHIRTMVKNDFLTTYERYVQAQAVKKAQADVNSFFA